MKQYHAILDYMTQWPAPNLIIMITDSTIYIFNWYASVYYSLWYNDLSFYKIIWQKGLPHINYYTPCCHILYMIQRPAISHLLWHNGNLVKYDTTACCTLSIIWYNDLPYVLIWWHNGLAYINNYMIQQPQNIFNYLIRLLF